ncbi:MAG TPA: DUF6088 family protein [Anaerolineales bacterium]|nr:DUF6088 family protein [Anaerolineales bacterium]
MMKTIESKLISRVHGLGRGVVITPNDFLDLSSHETVRKILSRLTARGKIRRLLRGVYEYPAESKLLKAPAPPDTDAIARAIARARGWTIIPTGETALNRLGLSTQVPAQWRYFTDGPNKKYTWQGRTLVFTHRANKEVSGLSPKTALVVQALKALGKARAEDIEILAFRSKLSDRERARALREARPVTAWVYDIIKKIAAPKRPHA